MFYNECFYFTLEEEGELRIGDPTNPPVVIRYVLYQNRLFHHLNGMLPMDSTMADVLKFQVAQLVEC